MGSIPTRLRHHARRAFDRFGCSLADLVRALEESQHLGVGFVRRRRVFHRDQVATLRSEGHSLQTIAQFPRVSRRTVARILHESPAQDVAKPPS